MSCFMLACAWLVRARRDPLHAHIELNRSRDVTEQIAKAHLEDMGLVRNYGVERRSTHKAPARMG